MALLSYEELTGSTGPVVEFQMPEYGVYGTLELYHSCREFFLAGLLPLPYDPVAFIIPIRNLTFKFLVTKDGSALIVTPFFRDSQREFKLWHNVVDINHLGQIRFHPLSDSTVAQVDLKTKDPDLVAASVEAVGQMVLVSMLVLCMPQFEHVEVERPPALQRARAKAGKAPCNRLIQIRLKPELRAAYDSETHSGVKMRPHWRRGHLRRLETGRVVPVMPCMVNFNGEPIAHQNYEVK